MDGPVRRSHFRQHHEGQSVAAVVCLNALCAAREPAPHRFAGNRLPLPAHRLGPHRALLCKLADRCSTAQVCELTVAFRFASSCPQWLSEPPPRSGLCCPKPPALATVACYSNSFKAQLPAIIDVRTRIVSSVKRQCEKLRNSFAACAFTTSGSNVSLLWQS
jgi:hypothetical protein